MLRKNANGGGLAKYMNLGRMLEETCMRHADRAALIHEGKRISYGALDDAVNALAGRLKKAGLNKGDSVAVMLPNCPEFVIAYFAVQKIGAVAITINTTSTSYELRHLLGNSDAKCLITAGALTEKFNEIRTGLPLCKTLFLSDGSGTEAFLGDPAAQSRVRFVAADTDVDDPAVMIYTSGLTGRPLGAVLTHRNLRTQSDLLMTVCQATENDRGLAVIPFFHSFGAVANMLSAIRLGASMVLTERSTPESILGLIEKEKVTYVAAVPRLFIGMIMQEGTEKFDLSSLKFCITGGAAMPVEMFSLFEKKFKVKVMEGYGLTEASPVCTFSRIGMAQKYGSVGIAVPGVEVRVVESGSKEAPRGSEGELIVRGKNVMKGYYRDEEATALVLRDGWLYTGDLARMDEDGYIFLTGRKKRMIITSGFNVYPREVEIVLDLHPAVQASRVVGVADLMRGEAVKAVIVRKSGMPLEKRELVRHCRSYLSPYKVPRDVEFVETLD
jgi:long-chain acyl-CoA synthetase